MYIVVKNLYKSFGKNEVLKGINIKFNHLGITAILGPNGSGKTTLIKSILGMVIPDQGKILINNQDIKGKWLYRNQIDYLPQTTKFPENLKVGDLIKMIKDIRNEFADDKTLIEKFDLIPFIDKRIRTLSGGTKQKVNILLSLMYNNPILILDEPTNGLDPVALILLKDFINEKKKEKKTILLTTHIMSLVEEMADEIIFLLEGKVHFRGSVKMLLEMQKEKNMERAIAKMLQKKN